MAALLTSLRGERKEAREEKGESKGSDESRLHTRNMWKKRKIHQEQEKRKITEREWGQLRIRVLREVAWRVGGKMRNFKTA